MITASEMGKIGGKKSVISRFKNKTKDEISAIMKSVRLTNLLKDKSMKEITTEEALKKLPLYFEFGDSDRPVKVVLEDSYIRVYALYDGKFVMKNDLYWKVLQKGYGITKEVFDKRVKEFNG
jgi:hypothetical protein